MQKKVNLWKGGEHSANTTIDKSSDFLNRGKARSLFLMRLNQLKHVVTVVSLLIQNKQTTSTQLYILCLIIISMRIREWRTSTAGVDWVEAAMDKRAEWGVERRLLRGVLRGFKGNKENSGEVCHGVTTLIIILTVSSFTKPLSLSSFLFLMLSLFYFFPFFFA